MLEIGHFTLIDGQLYKRGLSQPLLKCLGLSQVKYVLEEVHEGSCGQHLGAKSLAMKILRDGYLWPTMVKDSSDFIKQCQKC